MNATNLISHRMFVAALNHDEGADARKPAGSSAKGQTLENKVNGARTDSALGLQPPAFPTGLSGDVEMQPSPA